MTKAAGDIMNASYVVTMPDGSRWAIPLELIARDRAEEYADEFGGDIERSLAEDTIPLFTDDTYEAHDWAANNMNWSDVKKHARELPRKARAVDYQEGWMNGEWELGWALATEPTNAR
jgi:hypothetical protein